MVKGSGIAILICLAGLAALGLGVLLLNVTALVSFPTALVVCGGLGAVFGGVVAVIEG